ncbi:hypothetical protein CEXT_811241 [Caerostris extrusa]|uniref:Uncharacterized protein n=1 Tax=Caerostris extrusa TaxID=172846 RepID=A0AAV4SFM4_CAEEX|nr:hypothetical protein CEXT_811241 [Caerostris extrusa]
MGNLEEAPGIYSSINRIGIFPKALFKRPLTSSLKPTPLYYHAVRKFPAKILDCDIDLQRGSGIIIAEENQLARKLQLWKCVYVPWRRSVRNF